MSVIEPAKYWKIVVGRYARGIDTFRLISELFERVTVNGAPHRVCVCGEACSVPRNIIDHIDDCTSARDLISKHALTKALAYVERQLSLVHDDGDDRLDQFCDGKEICVSCHELPAFSLPDNGPFKPDRFPLRRSFFSENRNNSRAITRYQRLLEGHTVESFCESITHSSL